LAAEILALYEKKIESVTIVPSAVMGDFEIKLDDHVIYSKRTSGRLPNLGEVEQLLAVQFFKGK
jgi:predicted Rdx family selenoprotein